MYLNKGVLPVVIAGALVLYTGLSFAKAKTVDKNTVVAEANIPSAVIEKIKSNFASDKFVSVRPSQASGLYEINMSGQFVYMTADGYLVLGHLIDLDKKRDLTSIAEVKYSAEKAVANIEGTEVSLDKAFQDAKDTVKSQVGSSSNKSPGHQVSRRAALGNEADGKPGDIKDAYAKIMAGIPDSQTIIYEANGAEKAVLTVFTDHTCPFCKRFHSDVLPKLNKAGVKVRYMLFPRAGVGSITNKEMDGILCSKDPRGAMDRAFVGEQIPSAPLECNSTVASLHYKLGRLMMGDKGGTPTMFSDRGVKIVGTLPVGEILQRLN